MSGKFISTFKFGSILAVAFIIFFMQDVKAYKDENSPQKWSPKYLFGESRENAKLTGQFYSPRMSRFDRYHGLNRGVSQLEGSLGSRNPGFYSRSLRGDKRSTCINEGETCLYRSALAGAVIKLRCCNGSFCAYKGNNGFICMDREEILSDDLDDYSNVDSY